MQGGDVVTAKWYKERRDERYVARMKTELSGEVKTDTMDLSEIPTEKLKQIRDILKSAKNGK